MSKITRRKFVRNSSLLAAAMAVGGAFGDSGSPSPGPVPNAIVIGSGFAGTVTALRLAEAGIPVTLLERGQEWPFRGPDSFPTDFGDRRTKLVWREAAIPD